MLVCQHRVLHVAFMSRQSWLEPMLLWAPNEHWIGAAVTGKDNAIGDEKEVQLNSKEVATAQMLRSNLEFLATSGAVNPDEAMMHPN